MGGYQGRTSESGFPPTKLMPCVCCSTSVGRHLLDNVSFSPKNKLGIMFKGRLNCKDLSNLLNPQLFSEW